jgi:hypothetical protein
VTATGPGDDGRIINIRRLREFAVHGIHASVREEVWLYFGNALWKCHHPVPSSFYFLL